MAFVSLKNRINSLPLILCGPIVRRCDQKNISIWIACKHEVELTLTIHRTNPKTGNHTYSSVVSSKAKSIKFGRYLHIALLTVQSYPYIVSGEIYAYNIIFNNYSKKTLISRGIFSNHPNENERTKELAYANFKLPTFCLPHREIENIRIVHGSCRKPHGGKTDALNGLNNMLHLWATMPEKRPQILCLTGDQIYADEVASSLLEMLIDASISVVGINEGIPAKANMPKYISDERFKSGKRKKIIARTGPLGVGEDDLTTIGENHLIFLSEFYTMYLFAWSDVLWPKDFDDFPDTDSWDYNEISKLETFFESLQNIRKTLANISTLMIFDDHDVTDDWFITARWSEKALKGSFSRRLIQNGLSAYAIFQAWGNTPDRFSSSSVGGMVLNHLSKLVDSKKAEIKLIFGEIGRLILPKLATLNANTKIGERYILAPGQIKWDFHIDFQSFRVIFLDCRTQRSYHKDGYEDTRFSRPRRDITELKRLGYTVNVNPNRDRKTYNYVVKDMMEGVSGLIQSIKINEQLHLDNSDFPENYKFDQKFLLLISPSPVIGNFSLEDWQKTARHESTLIKLHDKDFLPGMYTRDQEAWSFFEKLHKLFLRKVSNYKRVIILSGDVHYAFSVHGFNNGAKQRKNSRADIVNLVSSSLKNSDVETLKVGNPRFTTSIIKIHPEKRYEINIGARYNEYLNLTFIDDNKSYTARYSELKPLLEKISLETKKRYKLTMDDVKSELKYSRVLGKDNIGLIKFGSDGLKFEHQLWTTTGYDGSSSGVFLPFISHKIIFINQ